MFEWLLRPATLLAIVHELTVLAVLVRVITVQPATGVALAWILIVAMLPAVGITLYLLIGERRIGTRRATQIASLTRSFRVIGDIAIREGLTAVQWDRLTAAARAVDQFGLINAAQHELIMTTPYFVPDDLLLRAVRGAAGRGVQVSLIMPEKVDSLLTRYASRSYYDEMRDIGVKVYHYQEDCYTPNQSWLTARCRCSAP